MLYIARLQRNSVKCYKRYPRVHKCACFTKLNFGEVGFNLLCNRILNEGIRECL